MLDDGYVNQRLMTTLLSDIEASTLRRWLVPLHCGEDWHRLWIFGASRTVEVIAGSLSSLSLIYGNVIMNDDLI
jgi:hypothetical protein